MFHDINGASKMDILTKEISTTTDVCAFTEVITLLTVANTTNFTKMMDMFKIQLTNTMARPSTTTDADRLNFNCYTHGRGFNSNYPSCIYHNRADSYEENAPRRNKKGGPKTASRTLLLNRNFLHQYTPLLYYIQLLCCRWVDSLLFIVVRYGDY